MSSIFSQEAQVKVINDTTELQEYSNGQKLKVNFHLNGRILTIKEKDKLLNDHPGILQEFNIKNIGNEVIGEINFQDENISIDVKNESVTKGSTFRTLNIAENLEGKSFPDFTWTDTKGNALSLQNLKGKVVVFNFWHTSCVPCIAEMPLLNELVKKYSGKEVVFVSPTPNTEQELKTFLSKQRFDYNQVSSVDTKTIFSPFPGWPIHVVINDKGIIEFAVIGKQNNIEEKLETSINRALKKIND
jgi:thiol-disulfide isomerase/thioredoxin